jgi:RNA polymerase sigma-70 factor, ECF subfamily
MRENAAVLLSAEPAEERGETTDRPRPNGAASGAPSAVPVIVEPVLREPSRPRAVEDSFEAFFQAQYTNLLRAMYLVTGNRHEAEEVTQDAFVRALERWDRVRQADNRAGYLYRIALNLYRSKLRRVARATRKTMKPVPETDPFEAADDRDAVGRAMTALPSGQREAVVLVEWLGMTDEEAGDVLGISPVTVRVRRHRARGNMRPILERAQQEDVVP